ncbi:hypothetical protein JYT28_01595, partial [Desulfobulbus sp. AH-315-M07]|nr:hypothetical protein [Desulfobulbus sp. AH-315-M07]
GIAEVGVVGGRGGGRGGQRGRRQLDFMVMQPLKAHVKDGQLVLDNPVTDLPEGEVIYLHPVEAEVGADDGFDDEERAALLSALDEGIAAGKSGEHSDADKFITELLADT